MVYPIDLERSSLSALWSYLGDGDGVGEGDFYLEINETDANDQVNEYFKKHYPKLIIHRYSEMKENGYVQCAVEFLDNPRKCSPYPLIFANFVIMPMWNVAIISVGSWNCSGHSWTIKAFGRWFVFSEEVGCA
ncbi:hypothetical protein [Nitrospirillum sp. BR 11163]|uniref:hypothetical protein n=1 Tax=Nitrospirillum sp. BR 11163 TaxID=3104323 RepID=UPI002AFEED3C|nr:hypothetical protein [Nitrospirillum sp. BR 11163]MEA1676531.1 hypothetical protein [Nitrospirillum sp. BR 11163]